MKILYVYNYTDTKYDVSPTSMWNMLPYLLKKKGAEVLGIGKHDLYKFYFKYLEFKPDLIITCWVPAAFVPIFCKKLGLINCPIIHRWEDYYAESMTRYPYSFIKLMEEFTAQHADYIITVLKDIRDRAQKKGKTVFLLPYGVTGGNKKTKINLEKLKTRKNNLKIVYSGEQSRYKRVDRIVNAVKGIDCDLFLLGKINPQLMDLAKGYKNIHFIGHINPKEIITVLKQADILVNTANHDISMKFLDYISAGKPILALDGRPKNFFRHKETAFLTKDFKAGLIELIKNKGLREKLSKNLKKIKLYSWEEVADIHLKLYREILSGNKKIEKFKTSYYHI